MLAMVKERLCKEPLFCARHTGSIFGRLADMNAENRMAYWRANLRLVALCLTIWFVCSYGFGLLLVEQLNQFRIGGFKLGFWFAQQGSIYIFVALIFFYAWRMNRIDRQFDVHED